jgi:hypothetical protein
MGQGDPGKQHQTNVTPNEMGLSDAFAAQQSSVANVAFGSKAEELMLSQ